MRQLRGPLGVLLVALLIRAWVWLDARDAPYWLVPQVDEVAYLRMAESVANGIEPVHGAWYMTPGYAWLLAAALKTGVQVPAVKTVQLVLGALSSLLLFLIARRCFDARVGWFAALAWSLLPATLLHEILILKPTVTVLLAAIALWLVIREGAGTLRWGLAGLVLGAAALLRAEMLLVALGLVAAGAWARRRDWPYAPRTRAGLVAAALALLAVVAVPTGQNLARGGGFVVLAYGGGPNFYIGNHERADGSYLPLRPDRSDAAVEEADAIALAEAAAGRDLDAAGVSRHWTREGLRWWAAEPGRAIALTLKKAVLLWSAWEGADVLSTGLASRWVLALRNPVVVPGLLLPGALAGLWFTRRRRELWPLHVFLGASWLALTPFFVFERFRLPMIAVATIFAGAAVFAAIDGWREGRRPRIALAVVFTVALAGLLSIPSVGRNEAVLHTNIGGLLLQQGRYEEALEEFLVVRRESPSSKRIEINIATALNALGRRQEALRSIEVALRYLQSEARGTGRTPAEELTYSHVLAGDILVALGRAAEAAPHYRAALALAPGERRIQEKLRQLGFSPQ